MYARVNSPLTKLVQKPELLPKCAPSVRQALAVESGVDGHKNVEVRTNLGASEDGADAGVLVHGAELGFVARKLQVLDGVLVDNEDVELTAPAQN